MCCTSPPYYGLRNYNCDGQIGLEPTPDAYVAEMVAVFREVRRVLRDDGTLWLNIGDSYSGSPNSGGQNGARSNGQGTGKAGETVRLSGIPSKRGPGIKPKDLLMIPAMVALALRADGWFLRSDIIWHKPNPMPESVTDRPTSAHEHVFLLSKSGSYFYDAAAIAEVAEHAEHSAKYHSKMAPRDYANKAGVAAIAAGLGRQNGIKAQNVTGMRNARNVWTITTQPYSGAHFATMPPELVERCVKAGSKPGDMILDPFGGAGTTGLVADRLGRSATLIELNPTYAALAQDRITDDAPLLMAIDQRRSVEGNCGDGDGTVLCIPEDAAQSALEHLGRAGVGVSLPETAADAC
ncbi:MAG: DNA-methyltransferase [Janthinobacterium lividum]